MRLEVLLDNPTEGLRLSSPRTWAGLSRICAASITSLESDIDLACQLGDNFAVMDRSVVKFVCDRNHIDAAGIGQAALTILPLSILSFARVKYHMSPTKADTFSQNRAVGSVAFNLHNFNGTMRRGMLAESGSLRVRFPSSDVEGLSAVFINTAGGVAGGDRFDVDISADVNSQLTVTTAAAEKIYRSHGSDALLSVSIRAGEGAHVAWLPQETILFDQARVRRQIDLDLAETASILFCEMVVFGRTAMGESLRRGKFLDCWRLRRGGRLLFAENVRLDGNLEELLSNRAVTNGRVAVGTILVVPGDESIAERIRDMSECFRGDVGVSSWNGFAMVRFCAQDAAQLRADAITVLSNVSRSGLPRSWFQ